MSRICARCGGEGIDMNGVFCTRCPEGRLKRAQDDASKKAAEAKKKEGPPKPVLKSSPVLDVKEGDWVKYNGYICSVYDVDGTQIYVIAVRKEGSKTIIQDGGKGWVSGIGLKPMAIQLEDIQAANAIVREFEGRAQGQIKKALIDQALDAKDKKLFLELTEEGLGDE